MDVGAGDLAAVTGLLAERARLLAAQVAGGHGAEVEAGRAAWTAEGAPDLRLVRLARELRTLAGTTLRLTVERAQADGVSWQEIGAVLGVGREAAFQRFGRPVGQQAGAPSAPVITDAADRAITVLTCWFEGRYGDAAAAFDAAMAEKLPAGRLAVARDQLTGTAGQYRRLGDDEPLIRQLGDYTVADIPLEFEVGEMKGRVAFDRSGRVAGLYVLPPNAP